MTRKMIPYDIENNKDIKNRDYLSFLDDISIEFGASMFVTYPLFYYDEDGNYCCNVVFKGDGDPDNPLSSVLDSDGYKELYIKVDDTEKAYENPLMCVYILFKNLINDIIDKYATNYEDKCDMKYEVVVGLLLIICKALEYFSVLAIIHPELENPYVKEDMSEFKLSLIEKMLADDEHAEVFK